MSTPASGSKAAPGFLVSSPTLGIVRGKKVYAATNNPEGWQPPVQQQNEGFKFRDTVDRFTGSRQEAVDNPGLLGPLLGGDQTKIAKFKQLHKDIAEEQPRSSTTPRPPINEGPYEPSSAAVVPKAEPKAEQTAPLSAQAKPTLNN